VTTGGKVDQVVVRSTSSSVEIPCRSDNGVVRSIPCFDDCLSLLHG
jgi:hypothetical protein